MRKRFFNSLSQKMTFYYGSVFFFLMVLLAFAYYAIAYYTFLDHHIRTSRQLAKIISKQTDNVIDVANRLEVRVLESKYISDYIFEKARTNSVTEDWKFRETLYQITGYNYEFYHMNIVNLGEGTLHTFGEEYAYKPYTATQEVLDTLILPTLALEGSKNILPPQKGCLYAPRKDVPVLTISRGFGQYPLSQKTAVIEIQLAVDSFEKIIAGTLYAYENGGEQVLIFDREHNPIYPLAIDPDLLEEYLAADNGNAPASSLLWKDHLVTSFCSGDTGITTMLITPNSYLVENRQFYLLICLFFFVLTFGILTLITHRLAHRITAPLTRLKEQISSFELGQTPEAPGGQGPRSFNELEVLDESYRRMQERLTLSLETAVTSRTLAIHSQMTALQAQMDSHFLYNTLTIISIIAEDNEDPQAASMCIKLTKMLRYVTEDISRGTTMAQELTHTNNYTDLLSIRFGSGIEFRYDPEPALNTIPVPRLILQPLVENCVKYSRGPQKILKISIRSWIQDHYWYINVTDNGNGFSDNALQELLEKTRRLNLEQENPTLAMGGMGLANIYLRLKLYYKDQFVFRPENDTDSGSLGGASVTIGGILNEK